MKLNYCLNCFVECTTGYILNSFAGIFCYSLKGNFRTLINNSAASSMYHHKSQAGIISRTYLLRLITGVKFTPEFAFYGDDVNYHGKKLSRKIMRKEFTKNIVTNYLNNNYLVVLKK